MKASNNLRTLPEKNSEDIIDFSTNDYLNLSKNPEILLAAYENGKKYGCGATGSRLLSGNLEIFTEFEEQIAKDKQTESAMIFCSGYQANITVLAALCDKTIFDKKEIVLFFDKQNHASLYKAVVLAQGKLERYRHNDLEMLESILKKYDDLKYIKFIVSETIFGMDGDIVNLEALISIAKKYNAILYLDEAHATGIFGTNGYGLSTNFNLSGIECIIMGTFSKALGTSGAYIACSKNIKNYLLQKCSGFIYSTAPSPLIIGAARKSWELIRKMDKEREKLLYLSYYCKKRLNSIFNQTDKIASNATQFPQDKQSSCTNIIPIKVKTSLLTIEYRDHLYDHNILVSAVRPPTVPTPRIRIAITLKHQEKDIDYLCESISSI